MGSMSKVMQKIRDAAGGSDELSAPNAEASLASEELVGESPDAVDAVAETSPEEPGALVEAQPALESIDDTSSVSDGVSGSADRPDADVGDSCVDDTLAVAAAAIEGADDQTESSAFVPDEPAPAKLEPKQPADQVPSVAGPAEPAEIALSDETVEWPTDKVDPVVLAFHDRYAAICEQYRSIRARLLTMNSAHKPQMLVITSAIPEEGKSVSTVNLGLIMAEGGEHRILIIDADFRRPSIPRMLGLDDHTGLADVLRGDVGLDQAIQPTPFPNLKLLSAGKVRDTSHSELLGGPNTEAVLDELRHQFDYTFVDTPPVTTVSDVCLLAPYCDGAIIVVQMRRTPEPTVQQAIRTLQANNVKVVGSILSKSRDRGSGYYASYYSSYYYR